MNKGNTNATLTCCPENIGYPRESNISGESGYLNAKSGGYRGRMIRWGESELESVMRILFSPNNTADRVMCVVEDKASLWL